MNSAYLLLCISHHKFFVNILGARLPPDSLLCGVSPCCPSPVPSPVLFLFLVPAPQKTTISPLPYPADFFLIARGYVARGRRLTLPLGDSFAQKIRSGRNLKKTADFREAGSTANGKCRKLSERIGNKKNHEGNYAAMRLDTVA